MSITCFRPLRFKNDTFYKNQIWVCFNLPLHKCPYSGAFLRHWSGPNHQYTVLAIHYNVLASACKNNSSTRAFIPSVLALHVKITAVGLVRRQDD